MTLTSLEKEYRKQAKIKQKELDDLCKENIELAKQRYQKICLAEVLMTMIEEHCTEVGNEYYHDSGLSTNENAFFTLEQMGLITKKPGKMEHYRLRYDLTRRIRSRLEKIIYK